MSVLVLTSASGSPGVTTTTVGLAREWSGPAIAVEADATGGSAMLAGYFRGFQPPGQSVVDLALAHRAGRLAEQLPSSLIPIDGSQAAVLPGARSHPQAHSLLGLWQPLTMIWRALGTAARAESESPSRLTPLAQYYGADVLVDAGRLGMQWYPEPLLNLADAVLLLTRSDLPSLAAAKQWAHRAKEHRRAHPETPEWSVVLVGQNRPYTAHEVSTVLGLSVVGCLSHDPRGATVYSHGEAGRRGSRLRTDLSRLEAATRAMLADAERLLGKPGRRAPIHPVGHSATGHLAADHAPVGHANSPAGQAPSHTLPPAGDQPYFAKEKGGE